MLTRSWCASRWAWDGDFAPYWSFGGGFGTSFYNPYVGGSFYADTIDVRTIDSYEASATIQLLRERTATGSQTYDVQDVISRLASTIELPG